MVDIHIIYSFDRIPILGNHGLHLNEIVCIDPAVVVGIAHVIIGIYGGRAHVDDILYRGEIIRVDIQVLVCVAEHRKVCGIFAELCS